MGQSTIAKKSAPRDAASKVAQQQMSVLEDAIVRSVRAHDADAIRHSAETETPSRACSAAAKISAGSPLATPNFTAAGWIGLASPAGYEA